jgi:isopenicillin N synthase-like dioxygenase
LLEESADPAAGQGDLHEAFDFASEDARRGKAWVLGDYRQVSNVWPENLPGFRETLIDYSVSIRILAKQIFSAFALSLGLAEDYFEAMTDRPMSLGRILYYPSQEGPPEEHIIGNGPHTDHECFTILCQDTIPALQVRNKSGDWIDAPPIRGSFVVNIGDLMARWTNDLFTSTLHRVANRSGQARYSIPFFIGTNPDASIEVLPSCVSAENPARYPPVVASEYILRLISQHLDVQPAS